MFFLFRSASYCLSNSIIANSSSSFACLSLFFSFASFAFVIIPFSPLKAAIATPDNINKTIIEDKDINKLMSVYNQK